jgi:hypothetical protein
MRDTNFIGIEYYCRIIIVIYHKVMASENYMQIAEKLGHIVKNYNGYSQFILQCGAATVLKVWQNFLVGIFPIIFGWI